MTSHCAASLCVWSSTDLSAPASSCLSSGAAALNQFEPNRTEPNQIKSNQQRLTFLLSHLFVLPRAAEQHQPHPLSGRESVSCARQMPGVRPPPQQQQPAALVLCRCASASPCGGSGASLRAALHSRQRPTNGAAGWLRKKERRPTSDAAWMTDAFV